MTPIEKLVRYASFLGFNVRFTYDRGVYLVEVDSVSYTHHSFDACVERPLQMLERRARERQEELSLMLTT